MSQALSVAMPAWVRPIRMPESIEITHAEPAFAIAGERGRWRLPFRLSKDVPPGATLSFQLWGGRNNKGVFAGVQVEHPQAEGYVAVELEGGSRVPLRPGEHAGTYVLALPDGGLAKGQAMSVLLGGPAAGGPGVRVGNERLLNKFFVLYCVPAGGVEAKLPQWAGTDVWAKANEGRIVAVCTMHILGGASQRLRAYAPASTRPGVPFAILIRPEDEFGDLSHQELGDLVVSVNGAAIGVEFDRVQGSTCRRARASLAAEGVYRFHVCETATGREVVTNPTLCSVSAQPVYWGMIHGHTEMSDGTGTLDQYFHQLQNEVGLDFAATADHDHLWETSDQYWATTCQAVKRWHQPQTFVTLLGYEWAKWRRNGDGDRNVYYLGDDRPMYRSDDGQFPSPPDLFAALERNREQAIVIPHHTGHSGNFCDWKDHSPRFERLVEIFQLRGSYECAAEDGNPMPERLGSQPPCAKGYVREALASGWRVGFTGGGDDHSGHWGTDFRFGWGAAAYRQGLMSVEARGKTREAIFGGLYARRVTATSGARILLTYQLDGQPVGSELSVRERPGLAACRPLTIECHGTAGLDRVDIIRGNRVVHSVPGDAALDLCFAWDDTDPIERVWLPAARYCDHSFTFYYVRVRQTDGEIAWASPVWIDP